MNQKTAAKDELGSAHRGRHDHEVAAAVVLWAESRGWTVETDPDRCWRFYDPHGTYVAYWSFAADAQHRY